MRCCGGADVDGSCRTWTEVASWTVNGSSLVCYPSPPHPVKVKINFDEAQKLTWKEVKCLYRLIKNNNLKSCFRTAENAT